MIPRSTDVLVIGGGIVGTACAEALASAGQDVVLVERADLAAGTSGACQTGVGWGLFQDPYDRQLCLAASAVYQEWITIGGDVEYRQPGSVIVGDLETKGTLRAKVEALQELNIACEWLDRAAIREAEPAISPTVPGGAFLKSIAQVNPIQVVIEAARRAKQLGARICTHTELLSVEIKGGKAISALTNQGRISFGTIVLAAGAWSSHVGRFFDLRVPVWPLKGHILVTEPIPPLLRHMISRAQCEENDKGTIGVNIGADGPPPGPPQVGTVLHSQFHGQLLIGSSKQFAGFDRKVDLNCITEMAGRACKLIPQLKDVQIVRTYTGFRPWTPDGRPLIGPTKQVNGLVFATGHGGEGVTLALLTGRLIAELLTGQGTSVDIGPLSPDRFLLR